MASFYDYASEGEAMPIAIVGIGCRLPGGASSAEKLWDLVAQKRSARREVPADRFNVDSFYHPNADKNGTMNNRGGYFLHEDIAAFDAPFFSISPAEAVSMDPLQRILLEVTYEAIESAGIPLESLAGSDTGCYVGNFFSDYDQISKKDPEMLPKYHSVGIGQAILSNRVSYCFGLNGPSLTIDTACSSSLTALHLACQSLRTRETKAAIVGATNAILNPDTMIGMTNLHFLSADSTCHTFDKKANGYARGEGMAALVLKPLETAIAGGDTIRAVIRGTSINSIGSHSGITVPKKEAQVELIKTAYKMAGCDPAVTAYCEAHGTGTQAGDPVEVGAIGETLGAVRASGEENKLYVGSVKTNIGHLEGASGLAAIIKAVKSLETGTVAPNLEFEKGNPIIDFEGARIRVPTEVTPWPVAGLRRVSVNSFGYGGANGHVILDDAYHYMRQRGINGKHSTLLLPEESVLAIEDLSISSSDSDTASSSKMRSISGTTTPASSTNGSVETIPEEHPRAFYFSAHEPKLVQENIRLLGENLSCRRVDKEEMFLDDLAFTLSERRSHHAYATTLVASSLAHLVQICKESPSIIKRGPESSKIAFIFTGQGAQWWAMGRELMQFPVFSRSIYACDDAVRSLGASWSLAEELLKEQRQSRINEAEISQPLCSALQIALVDLYASWNIHPSRVVGHSSGEIAAAYATGALTLESAVQTAYLRGLLSPRVKDLGFKGGMLAAGCSEEDALKEIQAVGTEFGTIGVACVNSPRSVTLSGDIGAIDEMQKVLTQKSVFARKLQVETAYHSHHMRAIADEYLHALKKIEVIPWDQRKDVTMFSSVHERAITSEDDLGGQYWVDNMVYCVRFSGTLSHLCQQKTPDNSAGVSALVELGPHSALAGPVKQILASLPESLQNKSKISYLSALIREKPPARGASVTAITAAGSLFAAGYPVKLHAINSAHPSSTDSPSVIPDLPTYSWNHNRKYWAESRLSRDYRFRPFPRTDVLGAPCSDWNPLEPRWRNFIRLSEQPWVRSHVVQGANIYPAAGFCCMAIEATSQLRQISAKNRATEDAEPVVAKYKLRGVEIKRALVVPGTEEGIEVIFSMSPESRTGDKAWREFHIFSYTSADGWAEHCRGSVAVVYEDSSIIDSKVLTHRESMSLAQEECKKTILRSRLYRGLDNAGLTYGAEFQGILKATVGSGRAFGTVKVTDTAAGMPQKFEFPRMMHPATMDTFLQMGITAITGGDIKSLNQPYVPMEIDEVSFSGAMAAAIGDKLECLAQSNRHGLREVLSSVTALGRDGKSFVSMKGVKFVGMASSEATEAPEIKNHTAIAVWQPDVALVTTEKMNKLLWSCVRKDDTSMGKVKDLELLAYYFFQKTLSSITETDVANMQPHHQKFVNYMKDQQHLVETNTHEQQTDEWHHLDSPEVLTHVNSMIENCAEDASDITRAMFLRMGQNLTPILKGNMDPLALMMKDDLLFKYYAAAQGTKGTYPQVQKYVSLLAHKHPDLEYLEIGAGTGGCTEQVLEALAKLGGYETPCMKSYTFSDVSAGFLDKAAEKFNSFPDLMKFAKLDIEKDPETQAGFENSKKFDVIVAANVLHATYDMEKTMRHVRKLLRPGGKLILLDMTHSVLSLSLIFGNLPGWWNCSEPWREFGPLLTEAQWVDVLGKTGFTGLQASTPDVLDPLEEQTRFMVATAVEEESTEEQKSDREKRSRVLVVNSTAPSGDDRLTNDILVGIEKTGLPVSLCTLESSLQQDLSGATIISLAEVDQPILSDISETSFEAVKRLTSESSGLVWLTRGSTSTKAARPEMSLFTGLARSLRAEREDVPLVTVDLDVEETTSPDLTDGLIRIFKQTFSFKAGTAVRNTIIDREFAQQDGFIGIKRSLENGSLNQLLASETRNVPLTAELRELSTVPRPLKVKVQAVGKLDSLVFEEDVSLLERLPEDSVDIQVHAVGLEMRDVLVCTGDVPDDKIGSECAGVIKAVGSRVQKLCVGDRVAALTRGTLATCVRVSVSAVQKIPLAMSFSTAAAVPLAGIRSYFALDQVARLRKGDKVLITAAMSPTGQFAMQLAKERGADVFLIVDSEEKRSQLLELHHVSEYRVFTTQTAVFADCIKRETNGRSVNVVLNSDLSGETLRSIQSLVAPMGRFIQLSEGASPAPQSFVSKNVTTSSLDVYSLLTEAPQLASDMFAEVMDMVRDRKIRVATPVKIKPFSQIKEALEVIKDGTHSGKVVVEPRAGDLIHVMPKPLEHIKLDPDGTYLLSGGLGGLGRSMARWMSTRGARNLIFTSRRGLMTAEANCLLADLHKSGVNTQVFAVDVADEAKLSEALSQALKTMPPLRGVIQGAMALHDQIFANMTHSAWIDSLRPKVQGSWALHQATLSQPLDFFIMLASCVGFVGNPGQSNYVAGGTYQVALAAHRRALGLPATTIDVGKMDEIGVVAEDAGGASDRHLSKLGYVGVNEKELMAILEMAMLKPAGDRKGDMPNGHFLTGITSTNEDSDLPFWYHDPVFSHMDFVRLRHRKSRGGASESTDSSQLDVPLSTLVASAATIADATQRILEAIQQKLAKSLQMLLEDMDPRKAISLYGVDSLIAVEMRNWFVRELKAQVPVFQIVQAKSLSALAEKVVGKCPLVRASE